MFKLPRDFQGDELAAQTARDNMARAAEQARIEERNRNYSYPKAIDEWWIISRDWWSSLILIADKYIDIHEPVDLDGNLSTKSLLENATDALNNKDIRLARFFDKIWWSAPDNGSIHQNYGWGPLCDLNSESYLLYDKHEF